MSDFMKPDVNDRVIKIPVTFDYKGGRGSNVKLKVLLTVISICIFLVTVIAIIFSEVDVWLKSAIIFILFWVVLWFLRFIVFNELHFKDMYEELLEKDFKLNTSSLWQIFEIADSYPYICYFKNGYKGLFVRMEMGTVTGKPNTVMYDHYEAISDAYNISHSLNMNMVHIDYMDNVGNDARMQSLYDSTRSIKNPQMQAMLVDIYDNIRDEMSRNYANFDIYLFLTRDRIDNFIYNVISVVGKMTEGNYLTYRIMDANEITTVTKAIFNLHEFSSASANEDTLLDENLTGIVSLKVYHVDGSVDKLNDTQEEKKIKAQENARRMRERAEARRQERKNRKNKKKNKTVENIDLSESIELFDSLENIDNTQNNIKQSQNNNQQIQNMQVMNNYQVTQQMQNFNNQQVMQQMQRFNNQRVMQQMQNFNNQRVMPQMQNFNNTQVQVQQPMTNFVNQNNQNNLQQQNNLQNVNNQIQGQNNKNLNDELNLFG